MPGPPSPATPQQRPPTRTVDGDRGGLVIRVSRGSGTGETLLSAFDDALRGAGVANFNLIRLSSVIPPNSTVIAVDPADQLTGGFGDALFCVYAVSWASTPGAQTWAGVAWSGRADGAGLFVEHSGDTEPALRTLLTSSLTDLDRGRDGGFTPAGAVIEQARCVDRPVCAIVVATYETRGWGN